MDVSEAQEVKELREENARLKKLVADLSLDKDMLQSVIPRLVERRAEVRRLIEEFHPSERRLLPDRSKSKYVIGAAALITHEH